MLVQLGASLGNADMRTKVGRCIVCGLWTKSWVRAFGILSEPAPACIDHTDKEIRDAEMEQIERDFAPTYKME
jgi:hypothetical protein